MLSIFERKWLKDFVYWDIESWNEITAKMFITITQKWHNKQRKWKTYNDTSKILY